jgi:Phage integrase family
MRPALFAALSILIAAPPARADIRILASPIHPHMLRHGCGYALANAGHDTRALQAWLGHKNIQHTVHSTQENSDAPLIFGSPWLACSRFWLSFDTCNARQIRKSVSMIRPPRCAIDESQELEPGDFIRTRKAY